MKEFVVKAEVRNDFGKNKTRRLRKSGRVPAVFYGRAESTAHLSIDPKAIYEILHSETGHNTIFSLAMDGKEAKVLIRDYQLDPIKGSLLHVDLLHVAMDVKLKVDVPIEIVGVPEGVKLQGGILEIVSKELEVECLPGDIPDHIKVDVASLMIGQAIRLGDVPVDPKIRFLGDKDVVIATVVPPKAEEEPKPAEVAEEAAAEPEVIKKGKAAAEEEEGAAEKKGPAEKKAPEKKAPEKKAPEEK
jgi:large subunit ribosomal protein L25